MVKDPNRGDGSDLLFVLPEDGINLEALERQFVVQALDRCGWNQTRAAALLGLNRDQVRYRIEKFGLTVPARRSTFALSRTRSNGASSPGDPAS